MPTNFFDFYVPKDMPTSKLIKCLGFAERCLEEVMSRGDLTTRDEQLVYDAGVEINLVRKVLEAQNARG